MKVFFYIPFIFLSILNAENFEIKKDTNPYNQMAVEILSQINDLKIKRIAVLPFSYAQSTSSVKDGSIISERLTMALIKSEKIEIIERSVLNKVLDELKLQSSGVIDASIAKELGKILGADAIITGTLVPRADGKIEVNARIIKTETAQAIGALQVYVVKDWLGGDRNIGEEVDKKISIKERKDQIKRFRK